MKECIYNGKNELRKCLIQMRNSRADRAELSKHIADSVCESLSGGNVLIYISIGSEVDTTILLARLLRDKNFTVYAPYTKGNTITPYRLMSLSEPDKLGNLPLECYDIETEKPTKIDICITPLVGFNADGHRIGYGKGCYDRFFKHSECRKIGLAYGFQQVNFLPDPHDVPLDCCVTEKDVIYFHHACNSR